MGSDGTIYFGAWDGKLWALNPDGTRKWVFRAGNEIQSSPALGPDGTLYFGCRDRKFYALGAGRTGKNGSSKRGPGWTVRPALAGDGTIYFGSWDKHFYALNPDGRRKWDFATGGEIVSSPAVGGDGTIYFGSHDGKFYALGADGAREMGVCHRRADHLLAGAGHERVHLFHVGGRMVLRTEPGWQLAWRLQTGGITESSPVIGGDGTLYVGVNDSMAAMTAEGKRKWEVREQEAWRNFFYEATPLVLSDSSISLHLAGGDDFNGGERSSPAKMDVLERGCRPVFSGSWSARDRLCAGHARGLYRFSRAQRPCAAGQNAVAEVPGQCQEYRQREGCPPKGAHDAGQRFGVR